MSFDCSRFTFDPTKDYAGVVMEQGRVQLDSDWNEWLAELDRRIQAGTLDVFGRAAYPATTPNAFKITASTAAGTNDLTIGAGRMYVDGLLAENHGILPPALIVSAVDAVENPGSLGVQITASGGNLSFALFQLTNGTAQQIGSTITASSLTNLASLVNTDNTLKNYVLLADAATTGQPASLLGNALYMLAPGGAGYAVSIPLAPGLTWDPALAELSGETNAAIDYTQQPYLPLAPAPAGNGPYLVYLDVWRRAITYVEDPDLVEKAVGVDTTGRLQTVWQVKLLDLSAANIPNLTCATDIPAWDALIQTSAGWLTNGLVQSSDSGPCCLSPNTGYTGMENQLYRLEIHSPGQPVAAGTSFPVPIAASGTATFKWSRDNASIITSVTAIDAATNSLGKPASELSVQSLGRDQVLGFSPGDWIELTDDYLELNPPSTSALPGPMGELHQIDTIDAVAKTITLVDPVIASFNPGDPTRHTRIKRWDQAGTLYLSDGKTIYFSGSAGEIPVPPAGTTLILENGITVSFGLNPSTGFLHAGDCWTFAARTADGSVEQLIQRPPFGSYHHYARLSIVNFSTGTSSDCRVPWPPATPGGCGCCCTTTVGDGQNSFGEYTSIQAAITATSDGGEICLLPGIYYENVLIQNRNDLVIRGCGWQTRVASAASNPANNPANNPAPAATTPSLPGPGIQFTGVLAITGCTHIKLCSFAVEAANGEIGVLIDGSGKAILPPANNSLTSPAPAGSSGATAAQAPQSPQVIDTIITEMILCASTLPAIFANAASRLHIESNRIAMSNWPSLWPAVYVSGSEIHIEHNWVGVQTPASSQAWLPEVISADVGPSGLVPLIYTQDEPKWWALNLNITRNPAGIQIAGPSQDVFIQGNDIDGGCRNGITLGNLEILNANGSGTGLLVGGLIVREGPCGTSVTFIPGQPPGNTGQTVVAGGPLARIRIERNRIRNTGLSGIGPVAMFDLAQQTEVISITDLTIIGNTIWNSLLGVGASDSTEIPTIGYGAICVPAVTRLVIRDNSITNFGSAPGVNACGIYVLFGELIEISRNHVLDERDWVGPVTTNQTAVNSRGGILIAIAMPPTFLYSGETDDESATPQLAEPGLPALRVEHNVVRVPLGWSFLALGIGPFAVVNNHFGCGGMVAGTATPLAQTVLILNAGTSLDQNLRPGESGKGERGESTFVPERNSDLSRGSVLFTNNVCQLETALDQESSIASVLIYSAGHLLFANNHCWMQATGGAVAVDALLVAFTTQVVSNRFEEMAAPDATLYSAYTYGILNVTSMNISTTPAWPAGTSVNDSGNLSFA